MPYLKVQIAQRRAFCRTYFGFGDQDSLTARGVEVCIFDIGESEGSESGAVHKKCCRGERGEEGGQRRIVPPNQFYALLKSLCLQPRSVSVLLPASTRHETGSPTNPDRSAY
jgi:hypothetical protein